MLVLLAVLGLITVGIGMLVLLRFPDRPGGQLRLLGLEVSSVGAGLPLVALGVLVVVVAATQRDEEQPTSAGDSGGGGGLVSGPPPADTPACIADYFTTTPRVSIKRQRSVPARTEDVTVLAADESKREEFGLVLTDDTDVVGAAKLSYDDDSKRTRVDGIVDGSCRRVQWSASDTPGADPSPVAQHSHLRSTLKGNRYDFELKPNDATFEMELHDVRE